MKSPISRWPEEERERGKAVDPDLLDRINLDGSTASLDGSRGTQTDLDGRLEVFMMRNYYPEKTITIYKVTLTAKHHKY